MVPFSNVKNGKIDFYKIKYDDNKISHSYVGSIEKNAGFILGLSHFYCEKNKINYALIANLEGIFAYKMFDLCLMDPVLYHKFIPKLTEEEKKNNGFDEAYIIMQNEKYIIVVPCFYYGYLFFLDFFERDLLYQMKLDSGISDICLWNNDYIFASLNHSKSQFILINSKTHQIEKNFEVIKSKSQGNYLISSSINGKLDLYTMNDLY